MCPPQCSREEDSISIKIRRVLSSYLHLSPPPNSSYGFYDKVTEGVKSPSKRCNFVLRNPKTLLKQEANKNTFSLLHYDEKRYTLKVVEIYLEQSHFFFRWRRVSHQPRWLWSSGKLTCNPLFFFGRGEFFVRSWAEEVVDRRGWGRERRKGRKEGGGGGEGGTRCCPIRGAVDDSDYYILLPPAVQLVAKHAVRFNASFARIIILKTSTDTNLSSCSHANFKSPRSRTITERINLLSLNVVQKDSSSFTRRIDK